jgi:hypothetical protein
MGLQNSRHQIATKARKNQEAVRLNASIRRNWESGHVAPLRSTQRQSGWGLSILHARGQTMTLTLPGAIVDLLLSFAV